MIASEGYPDDPKTGKWIDGVDAAVQVSGAVVFHAGTRREDDKYYTTVEEF